MKTLLLFLFLSAVLSPIGCNRMTLKLELPPLHEAAKQGDLKTVKSLIESGTSPNVTDERGNNAVYWAMHSENWATVSEYLASKGAIIETEVTDLYERDLRKDPKAYKLREKLDWLLSLRDKYKPEQILTNPHQP